MDYQKIVVVGRVGKDADMRFTPGGKEVASFSVAANREYTGSDGQKVKEVTWYRVATFGKLAEICGEYVKKGMEVLFEGRLNPDPKTGSPRTFQRQDGSTGTSYEVIADTVRLGSGGNRDAQKEESTEDSDIGF